MVRKRYLPPKTGIEWLKSVNYNKYLAKVGLGRDKWPGLVNLGKRVMIVSTMYGAAWLYNETSPIGWWTLKPVPKELKDLAHLYDRIDYPYPGDTEAMDEFIAKGGMIGTKVGPDGQVNFDIDGSSFRKDLQDRLLRDESGKLWMRMKNEVLSELRDKGYDIE